jgi:aminopeptidase
MGVLDLDRYADVCVRVGVNLQPGQTLFVSVEPEHSAFAHALAAAAWRAGAGDVQVAYRDGEIRRLHAIHAPDALLDRTPHWIESLMEAMDGHAYVAVVGGSDPERMGGVDPERASRAFMRRASEIGHEQTAGGRVAWSVVAMPTEAWANAVFGEPDVERLAAEIAHVVRLDEPDPVAAWQEHLEQLEGRASTLNDRAFAAIRFRGPGTDLEVGLLPEARWISCALETAWGQRGCINLPTEEVFTTPDRDRTEGRLRVTRSLNVDGTIVEGIELEVRGGRIVDARADRGLVLLEGLLDRDDHARAFGEVALVDASSRVGRRRLDFHDTLFDENQTCHVAFGSGYTDPVPGSAELSADERLAAGINASSVHIDLMVGGPDVEVHGVDGQGVETPIIVGDAWVLD